MGGLQGAGHGVRPGGDRGRDDVREGSGSITELYVGFKRAHFIPLRGVRWLPSGPGTIYTEGMRIPSTVLTSLVLLAALFVGKPASAQQYVYYTPPPPQGHTGGFFFRGTLGLGMPYAAEHYGGDDYAWFGIGGELTLSLGLSLPSAIAVHADLMVSSTPEPQVNINGVDAGRLTNLSFTTTAFGIGLSRFFPTNAYLTAGIGGAIMALESDDIIFESEVGGYLTIGVGKEWWLGPRYALGILGRATVLRVPDGADAITGIVPTVSATLSFD